MMSSRCSGLPVNSTSMIYTQQIEEPPEQPRQPSKAPAGDSRSPARGKSPHRRSRSRSPARGPQGNRNTRTKCGHALHDVGDLVVDVDAPSGSVSTDSAATQIFDDSSGTHGDF